MSFHRLFPELCFASALCAVQCVEAATSVLGPLLRKRRVPPSIVNLWMPTRATPCAERLWQGIMAPPRAKGLVPVMIRCVTLWSFVVQLPSFVTCLPQVQSLCLGDVRQIECRAHLNVM